MDNITKYCFGPKNEFTYGHVGGLSRDEVPIPLTAQQFALLELFLESDGHVLRRSHLIERLWSDRGVTGTNASLNTLVSSLRQALGDVEKQNRRFIRRESDGYRWIGGTRKVTDTWSVQQASSGAAEQQKNRTPEELGRLSSPGPMVAFLAGCLAVHQLLAELAEAVFIFGQAQSFLLLAPLNSALVFSGSIAGMLTDWKLTERRASGGLFMSLGCASASLMLVTLTSGPFLPAQPENSLGSVAWDPRAGFLKSAVLYPLILTIGFVHVPFHVVATLAAEIRRGRATGVAALLNGSPDAVAPDGAFFIRPRTLGVLLVALAVPAIPMTLQLMDNLKPGPATGMFSLLVLGRFATWWAIAFTGLGWYATLLNRMKRAALNV